MTGISSSLTFLFGPRVRLAFVTHLELVDVIIDSRPPHNPFFQGLWFVCLKHLSIVTTVPPTSQPRSARQYDLHRVAAHLQVIVLLGYQPLLWQEMTRAAPRLYFLCTLVFGGPTTAASAQASQHPGDPRHLANILRQLPAQSQFGTISLATAPFSVCHAVDVRVALLHSYPSLGRLHTLQLPVLHESVLAQGEDLDTAQQELQVVADLATTRGILVVWKDAGSAPFATS